MTELREFDIETVHVATAGGHNGGLPDVLHLSGDCGHLERAAAASTEDSSNTTNSWDGDRIREVDVDTRHPDEQICEWCEYRHTDTQLPPHTEREPYHDAEWLAELYHEDNHTAAEIADLCECSEWTICKWIHKHDIKIRYQSEHWLRARYHGDKMTMREIASECDIGKSTVERWLDRNSIPTRNVDDRLEDAEWLGTQYHQKELSTYDIADLCGCSSETVRSWLNKHDIQTRSCGRRETDDRLDDPEWLRAQYHQKGLSQRAIAEMCNCAQDTVSNRLGKFDMRASDGYRGGAD
jgi:DNA-directed RNA polymerase specialized sigma24 family protein